MAQVPSSFRTAACMAWMQALQEQSEQGTEERSAQGFLIQQPEQVLGKDSKSVAEATGSPQSPLQAAKEKRTSDGNADGVHPADRPLRFPLAEPSLSRQNLYLAASRRLWKKRTGVLARAVFHAVWMLAFTAGAMALAAEILHRMNQADTQRYAADLNKWKSVQAMRTEAEDEMNRLRSALTQRSRVASSLVQVASQLPDSLWLEEWELEWGRGGRLEHRLSGYALAESRVPEFLGSLERKKAWRLAKLRSTERVKGETVEKKTGIQANRMDLVRFQVQVEE